MIFYLLMPYFIIYIGGCILCNKETRKRVFYITPMIGKEKAAYWISLVFNLLIYSCLYTPRVRFVPSWLFYIGVCIYAAGLLLAIVSIVNFANSSESGMAQNGLYRISRNPMNLAYFVFLLGCVLLTQSLFLLILVMIYQILSHWVILAEERWCIQKYGNEYRQYMKRVRRYIGMKRT